MYTLLSTGDVPGASTYFNPLLQQTTIPCTSGTRPSSPPDGMDIYETDTRLYRSWNSSLSLWIVMGSNGPLSWTPTLTASPTNPTLGTGSVRSGQYSRGPNGMVHASWFIKFGTSGAAAGSGQYLVSLPVTAASAFGGANPEWWGVGRITDSGTYMYNASFYIPGGNLAVVSAVASGGVADQATPMAWSNNDEIDGTITYRAAAGS